MDAGDLFFVGSEGFDRGQGLLPQGLGPLHGLAGIRQTGPQTPLGFRRRPVDLRLVPLAARFRAPHLRLLTVKTMPAGVQQRTRPLDGLQRPLLQTGNGAAQLPPSLIKLPLAFIALTLTLVKRGLAPVSLPLTLVGQPLTLVGQMLTLVSPLAPLVGQPLSLVGLALALICRALTRSLGLAFRVRAQRLGSALAVHTSKDAPGAPSSAPSPSA